MLYSSEKLTISGAEYLVSVYLKRTRNLSYRISAEKITISLPNSYSAPANIEKHKQELLHQVKERILSSPRLQKTKSLLSNSQISVFGELFLLIPSSEFKFNILSKSIYLSFPTTDKQKAQILILIRQHYLQKINHRIRLINHLTVNKPISTVLLKNNKSTWGLCSTKGEITISIQLLFAPKWVIDYVIVHELCHLVHADHSAKFWSLVERFYPKYKQAKQHLRDKGIQYFL